MWKCAGLLPSVPNSAHGRLLSPPPPSLMGASLAVNAMPFLVFFFLILLSLPRQMKMEGARLRLIMAPRQVRNALHAG